MTKTKAKQASVEAHVMEQISSGDIKMKSRWHFVALQAILVTSASLFCVLAAVFISLTIHDIQIGRQLDLEEFGQAGDQAFLGALPVLMVLFAVIALSAAVLLVKHFGFSYRHKFNALLATVLLTVLGVSGIVSAIGLNDDLSESPPFKPLSTLQRLAEDGRVIGVIEQAEGDRLVIIMPDETAVTVRVLESTTYKNAPEIGDEVVIFGRFNINREFEAYGVRAGPPRVRHPLQDYPRVKGSYRDSPAADDDLDEINDPHSSY